MKRHRYSWLRDGEWGFLGTKIARRIGCCDCGLVHRWIGKITKDGRIMIASVRDDEITDDVRKKFKRRFVKR